MSSINRLLDQMLASGASDLHLVQGNPPRVRLAGQIQALAGFDPMGEEELSEMLRGICPPGRWQDFERSGDADFIYVYSDRARFRTNFNRQHSGNGAVFRAIPSKIMTLDDLGAPPVFKTFANYPQGLVLITSPGGNGKSTTAAAILDHINSTRARHIMTLEEPVEFVHSHKKSSVVQREVGVNVQSFPEGLLTSQREDVDVLLVGEMRDQETIELTVSAAETGVLVLATLYTSSALKTIDRVVDAFPSNQQPSIRQSLATSLKAICSQQLLRRADGRGRIAAYEILLQTLAASNTIREGKTGMLNQIIMSNRAAGMILMDDCIDGYLQQSLIDGREAHARAHDRERFAQQARAAG